MADAASGLPGADPSALFLRRIKSIPRSEIPDKIGDMAITPELLDDYKGHEIFLKERAKHPPHCYAAYDSLRLCFIQRLGPETCTKVMESYRPCARELQKRRLAQQMEAEDERRKILAAKARALEQAAAAAAAAAAPAAK